MKSKMREKFIATVMLMAFAITNSTTAVFAIGDYSPLIRMDDTMVAVSEAKPTTRISNGDSIVNLSLRDADITQVLRMFADQAGMNIIFSPKVEGTVTMDLVNIELEKAFNLVVSTNNLAYNVEANTLIISGADENISTGAQKNLNMIPVKYVAANTIADFLNSNIFIKNGPNPGVSTKPIASVNPATNEIMLMGTENDAIVARSIIEQFDKKPTVTTLKVNHVTPAEMSSLICDALIPTMFPGSAGGASTGGAAGVPTGFASDSSSSSSSGTSDGLAVGGGTLACTAEQSSTSDIAGLPYKNLSVVYFPTVGTIQLIGGSPSQLEMIKEYIAANDKKTPQAYLEIQIISLSESGSKEFNNTWQFLSKNFSFNASGSGGFSTNNLHPVFFAGHGFGNESEVSYPPASYSYTDKTGYLARWGSSPTLIYSMNYLIKNNKGRVLANPKIILTNGQESVIDLSSDYVKEVTTQYLDNGSMIGSQVQRDYDIGDDNGIKVTITPFISPDGYITMDINPEYNTIKEQIFTVAEDAPDNRDLRATLLSRRKIELKGVRVKDGETLVIGGMIQEAESKDVSKIPFLGDLPVVGMFFRSTSTTREKEEMVIMLTPNIIVDNEDAETSDLL